MLDRLKKLWYNIYVRMNDMKIRKELSLENIQTNLSTFGFTLSNEDFKKFSYSELSKIYRRAKVAYEIQGEISLFISDKLNNK